MTDPEELTTEEQAFRSELLQAAKRLDEPRPDLRERLLRKMAPERARGSKLLRWAVPLASLGLAAAVTLFLSARREPQQLVEPEPARSAVRPSPPAANPCARGYHAQGSSPLIDDFEDGNVRSVLAEGRAGTWMINYDIDREGQSLRYPKVEPRPDPRPGNRMALHLTGPQLLDWGAIALVTFDPYTCYDASVYAGIGFWAKGPSRIFIGLRSVAATPKKWGGTCEKDCYNDHSKAIDLRASWQHYAVRWGELRQRGYGGQPLDPASLNSIVILIHSEDTPFDIWIDDVTFLQR